MPSIKVLSAREVIAMLTSFGFEVVSQKGSHVKMRRVYHGERQTLVIPDHKELDRGTLRAIFRQSCRYIAEDELRPHFFTD